MLSVSEFIGRFHPVLVHLPIGIILIGLLLQWLSAREKYRISGEAIKIVLLTGTLTAILSCITGYLLSLSGDYEGDLVTWHMWMGIAVAATSALLCIVLVKRKRGLVPKASSFCLLVLILLTGHLGGSLTHGSNYLTAALFAEADTVLAPKQIENIQEALVYDDVIEPLLQAKCVGCHSAKKQKGGLRMDEPVLLMKGGKNGVVIAAGNAANSEMMKRMLLPREHEDHMPPKAKPQLNERQLALIHWWIEQGASLNKQVKDLDQPEKLQPVLLALQSNQATEKGPPLVPVEPVAQADEKAIAALRNTGAVVIPVAKGSNYLSVNFVTVAGLNDDMLKLLLPVSKQVLWLKASDSKLTDQALKTIAACTNLTILHLNNTQVTDAGLPLLNKLDKLRLLNLVNTAVSAKGLAQLTGLQQLQSVYLYKTHVNGSQATALKKVFTHATIDTGGYTLPMLSTDTQVVKAAVR